MLKIENLTCGYGSVIAASEISLTMRPGEILAILGANGAGKTSTVMAVMGHVRILSGAITLNGTEITTRPRHRRAELGIAVVPEGRRLFNDMTVDENLTVGGYSRPSADIRHSRERVFAMFPRLAERRRQFAGSMSGGEQQMLAIGRALMADPKVIFIDELSLGLMPKVIDLCLDAVQALRREGLAIGLVEQNTDRALEIADQVAVLSSGRLAMSGSAAKVRGDRSFFDACLGLGSAEADPAQQIEGTAK